MSGPISEAVQEESAATVFDFSPEGLIHLEAQPQTELTFALIRKVRALMEENKMLDDEVGILGGCARNEQNERHKLQARIALLEAERDIWRDRARARSVFERETWPDPFPAEIAARVEQKRKES